MSVDDGVQLMLIPSGDFSWVTGGGEVAGPDVVECLLSIDLASAGDVDDLVARAEGARGTVVSEAQAQPWGYSGTFADPDGHLWQASVPA